MRLYGGITKLSRLYKTGQSSVEFMISYGWVFLIVGLVLALLFYTGILNFNFFVSKNTQISGFSSNMEVTSAYANSTEMAIVVVNNGNSKANLSSVIFNINSANNSMSCAYTSLYPGQQTVCYASVSLSSPVYTNVYIDYSYFNGLAAETAVSYGSIFLTLTQGNIPLESSELITVITESGLPSGTRWYATLGSNSENSTSDQIVFYNSVGNYGYSVKKIYNVSGSCNTTKAPSSQSGNLNAGSVLKVVFLKAQTLCMLNMTISNKQSKPTASPFQQLLVFNASNYQNWEASNLNNIVFLFKNYSIVPSWLESGNSKTSQRTLYWLKIPPIPANSNLTVYMAFNMSLVNSMNKVNTGEAPSLSGTYGQYDDGANIFNFYDNFAGSSLNATKWASYGSNGSSGSLSDIIVNNGLSLTGGGYNLGKKFETWVYSNVPSSELTSNLTADTNEKGTTYSGIYVPHSASGTSTSTSLSVTNPYGYDSYLCVAAVSGGSASPYAPITSVSWTQDEHDGNNYTSIGHQTGSPCSTVAGSATGQQIVLSSIGFDNSTPYSIQGTNSGSRTSSSLSLSYSVSSPNSFVVIAIAVGFYGLSSVSVPAGCTAQQYINGSETYESAYIAVCPSQAVNSYSVTASLSGSGSASIVAYVFQPGNPNTFRWGFTDTAPTTWLNTGNGVGLADLSNSSMCASSEKVGSTSSSCIGSYTGNSYNNYSIGFSTAQADYYLNNYTSKVSSILTNLPSLSSSIGFSLSNEMNSQVNISWTRLRNTPPNGIMPSVKFAYAAFP